MARKDKVKKGITVDFTDVEGKSNCPEGSGRFRVASVNHKPDMGDDGALAWDWDILGFEPEDRKQKAPKTFSDITGLGNTQLFNLRNRLVALGAEVPKGPLDIDFEALVGLELEADIIHKESNDGEKVYQNMVNYMAVSDEGSSDKEDEDEDDVKVTDKSKKKRAKVEDDEDEDEAPVKKKKRAVVEDEDEDEAPVKSKKKKPVEDEDEEEEAPKSKKKKPVDDDEDEDEAPAKSKKKAKEVEPGDEYTEEEVREMDEKGLKSVIKKHDLDVDLDDYPSLRKQCIAVSKALDEAGLLTE